MVQRASSEAVPSAGGGGGHRESRMGLGIGYAAYQSGYNKLFTQVIGVYMDMSGCILLRFDLELWLQIP